LNKQRTFFLLARLLQIDDPIALSASGFLVQQVHLS